MPPLVSILIPTYNRSPLLRRTLGSVLAQSYRDVEVLISDNNSSDDTPAVVAEFAAPRSADARISAPSPGTPAMTNISRLLACAAGKYAVVLADDDFLLDYRYLADGVRILEERGVGLLVTDCVFGRPRREISSQGLAPVTSGREFFFGFWRGRYAVPVISNLFSVELARRCNPWSDPEILYGDIELWLKMMTLTDVAYYAYPAVYYYFHGLNIVSTMSLAMHRRNIRFIDNVARFAEPVFGAEALVAWRQAMVVEYCRIMLEERHWPALADLAAFRAAAGLEGHPLPLRSWLKLAHHAIHNVRKRVRKSSNCAFRGGRHGLQPRSRAGARRPRRPASDPRWEQTLNRITSSSSS